jgi:hypothetical protein
MAAVNRPCFKIKKNTLMYILETKKMRVSSH